MRAIVVILFAVLAVACAKFHPLSDEFIAQINKKATTWKAGRNFDLDQWEHVKTISSGVLKMTPEKKRQLKTHKYDLSKVDIPESFDSAEKWPKCESIREIRDQSRCGSCWAFAAVEAMSDRICIHSNSLQTRVSSEDLVTCCDACGSGCQGGWPSDAWQYWAEIGISTGGLYNRTDQGCKSYFLPECDDHPSKCRNYVKAPACTRSCDSADQSYTSALTYGDQSSLRTFKRAEDIQVEIMTNGPVEADFTVYEDFHAYKSGIYQKISEDEVGGHAVKIVGWGVENGIKYWKIANSWNPRWGENGYFRMIRGVDSCGIESDVVAALPKLN